VILFSVSFTGSEVVGCDVGRRVASRFGKIILELGGNNGELFMCVICKVILLKYSLQLQL